MAVSRVICADSITAMRQLPAQSVDMVLCDLPYGTTACTWDAVIPFALLWEQYARLVKPDGALVFTASQPFTAALIASNFKAFKYQWVWRKPRPSNPQLAKKQPLKVHEDIAVFCYGRVPYYPQGVKEIPESERKVHNPEKNSLGHCTRKPYVQTHTGYPMSVLDFPAERGLHPTQKPVALMEYLIRTYTSDGETVLDNTCGSGTTLVAAARAGRSCIGIEADAGYAALAEQRLREAQETALELAFA